MDISKTLLKANHTLSAFDSIATRISNGEGTIGQLVKNDSLYRELKNASKSLDILLNDVKTNPKRYVHFSVFGSNSSIKTKKTK